MGRLERGRGRDEGERAQRLVLKILSTCVGASRWNVAVTRAPISSEICLRASSVIFSLSAAKASRSTASDDSVLGSG